MQIQTGQSVTCYDSISVLEHPVSQPGSDLASPTYLSCTCYAALSQGNFLPDWFLNLVL